MVIQITARHDSVTDGMKRYAEEKGEKLTRFFSGLNRIDIVLDGQGPTQVAEIIMTVAGAETIAVSAEAQKMNAAIDAVIDKAERKVRRHKEKVRDHRGSDSVPQQPSIEEDESLDSYSDVIDQTEFPKA